MSFSEMNEPTEPALSDFARLSIIHRMVRAGLDQSGSAADWKMILESHLGILRKNQADTPTFNFTQALRLVTLDAEFRDLCGDPFHGVALLSTVVSEPTGEDENWFHNLPEPLRDLSEADEKIRTR